METKNNIIPEPKNNAQEMLVNADYQILDAAFDLDLFLKECSSLTDLQVKRIKSHTSHISATMADLTHELMPLLEGDMK